MRNVPADQGGHDILLYPSDLTYLVKGCRSTPNPTFKVEKTDENLQQALRDELHQSIGWKRPPRPAALALVGIISQRALHLGLVEHMRSVRLLGEF